MKVLVVDDEKMIRSLAVKILARAGFEVLPAESGEDGLKLFHKELDTINLVLVDMTMEGLSGLETLRAMREIKPDLPGLISSGHVIGNSDIPADLCENIHFLQKPYRSAELVNKVVEILGDLPVPTAR